MSEGWVSLPGMRTLRLTALAAGVLLAVSQMVPAQAVGTSGGGQHGPKYEWQLTPTGSESQFRGLAAVSADVAWIAGRAGQVLRTIDGGKKWKNVSPAGPRRCCSATSRRSTRKHAVIMSIGNGEDSRIYRTADGGKSWTETFRNTEPTAFYDCLDFNSARGLALSDPVDGKFRIASTLQRRQVLEGAAERPGCRRRCQASSRSRPVGPAWSPDRAGPRGSRPVAATGRGCSARTTAGCTGR